MKKLALVVLIIQMLVVGTLQPARAFWNLQSNMYNQMGYPTYGYSPLIYGGGFGGGIYGGYGAGYANYPMYYAPNFSYGYSPLFGGFGYNAGFGYGMYPWYDSSSYGFGYPSYDPYAGYYTNWSSSPSSSYYDDSYSGSYQSSYRSSYDSSNNSSYGTSYSDGPSRSYDSPPSGSSAPSTTAPSRNAEYVEQAKPSAQPTPRAPEAAVVPPPRIGRIIRPAPESTPSPGAGLESSPIPPARPDRSTEVEQDPNLAPRTSKRPKPRPDGLAPTEREEPADDQSSLEAGVCTDCTRQPEPGLTEIPIPPSRPKREGVEPRRREAEPQITGIRARNRNEERAQQSPIWNSFIRNFAQCAPGCEPVQYAAYGQRSNRSCHPSGEALDLGGMICDGKTYRAIDRGRFEEMVNCMRGKMKTLYRNGRHVTAGHHDHAHFSNGCHGGRTY